MGNHTEKQEIFDKYAKDQGYVEWSGIQLEYGLHLMNDDEYMIHVFRACDLVQQEQQNRIAERACIEPKGVMTKVDKDSITNPENLIR